MIADNALLTTENGSFKYKGSRQILRDVCFGVSAGEVLAVLGPNGAGKTTLLRCMMDMLHWDSGRTMLGGEDIRSIPARRLWSRMAYVPQARSAASSYTAFQTVLLGRSSRLGVFDAPSEKDTETADAVMRRLGIEDLADKPCGEISGGELQMVLIARAMAAEPEILILDEPESNLDFRNQLIVLDAVTSLASEGTACIFNTHYPSHALQRAHKSLILTREGTCMYGKSSAVVTEENIRKAFGVNAVIGEVETPEMIMHSVLPVSIAAGTTERDGDSDRVASVSIIISDNRSAPAINALLHEYSRLLIGRMGMPHRRRGLYLINVNVDGKRSEIAELTHRLSLIPGISVKTTYAKE